MGALGDPFVQAALASAVLFGLAAPLGKLLVGAAAPFMLAGLLYLGSGLGLTLWRAVLGAPRARLPREEIPWFAGAVLAGGVVAPALLMFGLTRIEASAASLLLTAEGVFTALIAWFVFGENFDRRVALGMAAITAGALLIATGGAINLGEPAPSALVLGACLAWGIDNNLTRRVSLGDAAWLAATKGLIAGSVNIGISLALGATLPEVTATSATLLLGFFAYGLSLALFIVALRGLGTARTGAYFGVAPFLGATCAVALLGEALTPPLVAAGVLMAFGVWLHLTERHVHEHHHAETEHAHWHRHDTHHTHDHATPVPAGMWHNHPHRHAAVTHRHPHYPDAHHRHRH